MPRPIVAATVEIRKLLDKIRSAARSNSFESRVAKTDEATTLIETITAAHLLEPDGDMWLEYGIPPYPGRIAAILHGKLGRYVSKPQLWEILYGTDPNGGAQLKTVDVFICQLRRKLKHSPWAIETLWGSGYRMVKRDVANAPSHAQQALLDNLAA